MGQVVGQQTVRRGPVVAEPEEGAVAMGHLLGQDLQGRPGPQKGGRGVVRQVAKIAELHDALETLRAIVLGEIEDLGSQAPLVDVEAANVVGDRLIQGAVLRRGGEHREHDEQVEPIVVGGIKSPSHLAQAELISVVSDEGRRPVVGLHHGDVRRRIERLGVGDGPGATRHDSAQRPDSPQDACPNHVAPLPFAAMSDKPTIRVVAAEAERDGRYLITQRRPEATLPLLWEFPGGKVEPGETDADALARELREEMDIRVEVGDEVLAVQREYDKYFIDFHVYSVWILSQEIKTLQVHDYRWVTVAELADYEFPAADQESVDQQLRGR